MWMRTESWKSPGKRRKNKNESRDSIGSKTGAVFRGEEIYSGERTLKQRQDRFIIEGSSAKVGATRIRKFCKLARARSQNCLAYH